MNRELNGAELAGYIKQRQVKQVRALKQAYGINPKLVIIKSVGAGAEIDTYVRLKERYGSDIGVVTEVITSDDVDMPKRIAALNNDETVHGIIVQLPLAHAELTDEVVNRIDPAKDVDGLGSGASYKSATADAINWLINGYGVELSGRKIVIVGYGRLVGRPLAEMWRNSGLDVTVVDESTPDKAEKISQGTIIVTAAGVPGLITADMIAPGAVVVDAGTTSENGIMVGDVDASVRHRSDITITPEKGGVGPLTVAMLFEHVINAAGAKHRP